MALFIAWGHGLIYPMVILDTIDSKLQKTCMTCVKVVSPFLVGLDLLTSLVGPCVCAAFLAILKKQVQSFGEQRWYIRTQIWNRVFLRQKNGIVELWRKKINCFLLSFLWLTSSRLFKKENTYLYMTTFILTCDKVLDKNTATQTYVYLRHIFAASPPSCLLLSTVEHYFGNNVKVERTTTALW